MGKITLKRDTARHYNILRDPAGYSRVPLAALHANAIVLEQAQQAIEELDIVEHGQLVFGFGR